MVSEVDIVERLRGHWQACTRGGDPDGCICTVCAEAADLIEALRRQVAEQAETLNYLFKWVERGMFDPKQSAKTAIEVLAYYPAAPWQNGRWDVDHKPYAAALYKAFPKAASIRATPPVEGGPVMQDAVGVSDADPA